METQLRVLIVEDSHSDALLLLRELKRAGYVVEHERVDNARDMTAALQSRTWDVILSDYSMPNFSATAALELLQEHELDLPFIIVSGTMGEEAAVSAMKAGAHDYFPKGRTTRLSVAIARELRDARERQQRQKAEAELKKHTRLTELLREVTTAANEASEVAPILHFAVSCICRFAGWELGHVYTPSRGNLQQGLISFIWYANDPDKFRFFAGADARSQITESAGRLAYRVFTSGNPEWLVDISYSAVGVLAEAGIQSVFAFPVFAQREVAAVIECFSTAALPPDESLLATIPHVATQVGHVIERVRVREEVVALYNATAYLFNADTLHDLGWQIVQGIVEEFKHVDCGLLLLDKQTGKINRLARAGQSQINIQTPLTIDGAGLVSKAIRDERIIYAPDVQQDASYVPNVSMTRSEIVIPLKTRSGVIGALDLQSSQRHYFTESDQRVLTAFAERAAAALEIVRLYEEINQHAIQLERRVAERTQDLQAAKEHVETILHNSSDAIILVKSDGTIHQTNPRFSEIFGYSSDEIFGKNLTDIISTEDAETVFETLQGFIEHRQYRRIEVLARRKDQSLFPVDAAFAAFLHKHEINVVCSLRDISAHKQLEQELRVAFEQQKALAELKTQFVSTVSHEYRTPLAIIQTSSSILMGYGDRLTEERKQEYLEKIQFQVNRLTNLLNDILEISRAETKGMDFNPERLNIVSLCRELVEDMQQVYPDQPIHFHTTAETSFIMGDARLLQQIVSNLLSNAIKYSPDQSVVRVSLMITSSTLTLTVADQGIGIPEEAMSDLFTTFHRAKNVGHIQGTGLGLAIVKNAVEAHQGVISVESEVGQGTTFRVMLPL